MFSWKRALGISKVKRKIAKATGIPTTKQGRARKRDRMILKAVGLGGSPRRKGAGGCSLLFLALGGLGVVGGSLWAIFS